MNLTRHQRWLLLAAAAVVLALCLTAVTAEAKKSSSSSSDSSRNNVHNNNDADDETPEQRVIRERKELRDRKIAEKKAKKAAQDQTSKGSDSKKSDKKKKLDQKAKDEAADKAKKKAAKDAERKKEEETKKEAKAKKAAEDKAKKEAAAEKTKKEEAKAAKQKKAEQEAREKEEAAEKAAKAEKKAQAEKAAAAKKKSSEKPSTSSSADQSSLERDAIAAAQELGSRRWSNEDEVDEAAEKSRAARMKNDAKARAELRAASSAANAAALSRKQERVAQARQARGQRRRVALEKAKKRSGELLKKRRDRTNRRQEALTQKRKKHDTRRKLRNESKKPEIVARGQEKLKWFQKQIKASKSRVIDINYSNFKKYVHATPRPYWLFVVITALNSRYNCDICKTVAPQMRTLAKLYYTAEQNKQNNQTNAVAKVESDFESDKDWDAYVRSNMPMFFVEVDIDGNQELFRQLNLQSAPVMIVLNPTAAATPPAIQHFLTSLPRKNRYVLQKEDISAGDINEFIQKVTGQTVSLTTAREPGLKGLLDIVKNLINSMDPVRFLLLCVGGVMICLLGILALSQWAWHRFCHFQEERARKAGIVSRSLSASEMAPMRIYSQYSHELLEQSIGTPLGTRSNHGVVAAGAFLKPRTLGLFRWWFITVGCLVYLFGISGGMFNILRGNSSFNFDFLKTWNIWEAIDKHDSHNQSVMEGFAMGVLQLVLASILIFLNRMSFTYTMVYPKGTAVSAGDRAKKIMFWFVDLLYSPVIWATLFYFTWQLIISIYTRKNGGYRHGFVWKHFQPHHLKPITKFLQQYLSFLPRAVTRYMF